MQTDDDWLIGDDDCLPVNLVIVASTLLLAAIVNLALDVGGKTVGSEMLSKLLVGEALRRRVYHGWYSTAKELCCVDC